MAIRFDKTVTVGNLLSIVFALFSIFGVYVALANNDVRFEERLKAEVEARTDDRNLIRNDLSEIKVELRLLRERLESRKNP